MGVVLCLGAIVIAFFYGYFSGIGKTKKLENQLDNTRRANYHLQEDVKLLKAENKDLEEKFARLPCEVSIADDKVTSIFNPCKEEIWCKIDKQSFMVINGEKIYDIYPKRARWQDFFDTCNAFVNFHASRRNDEISEEEKESIRFNVLKRLLNRASSSSIINNLLEEIDAQKDIDLQLNYNWARNNKFNPYKPETWVNAIKSKIVFIDNVPIFDEQRETHPSGNDITRKKYVFETDWEKTVKTFNLIDKDSIEVAATKRCKSYLLLCKDEDSQILFTINNFNFTKAKLDMIRQWDYISLTKVADEMNYCIKKKMGKNKMKQHLFYTCTPVDNYFFSDLYFIELYKKSELPDLMTVYFHEICMESDNPNCILDKSLYLADKPKLKEEILQSIQLD